MKKILIALALLTSVTAFADDRTDASNLVDPESMIPGFTERHMEIAKQIRDLYWGGAPSSEVEQYDMFSENQRVIDTKLGPAVIVTDDPYLFYGRRDGWSPYGNYLPEVSK